MKFKGYNPSTRLVYTIINSEKDNSGKVIVNLTKKGFAYNTDKQFSWEKKEQISFSKDQVDIPLGFYMSDTTFLCDYHRKASAYQKRRIVYSAMKFENQKIGYPFSMQKEQQLPLYNLIITGRVNDPDIAGMDGFVNNRSASSAGSRSSSKLNARLDLSIVERRVIGTTKVTTPAGVFECYKILEVMELDKKAKYSRFEQYIYLSKEYGVVKIEPVDMNKPAYYVVLTNIRNK
jgi:hypothetical protein